MTILCTRSYPHLRRGEASTPPLPDAAGRPPNLMGASPLSVARRTRCPHTHSLPSTGMLWLVGSLALALLLTLSLGPAPFTSLGKQVGCLGYRMAGACQPQGHSSRLWWLPPEVQGHDPLAMFARNKATRRADGTRTSHTSRGPRRPHAQGAPDISS